jgi:hypothetical protein
MFKSVCLDVILLLVLITTLFATSKSIYEEIEDRTMLTLMSKPLKKWEVLLGKYLGIILAGHGDGDFGMRDHPGHLVANPGDYLINVPTRSMIATCSCWPAIA